MHYQINRGGQMYGPYTFADLKRYVESGHILLTDLTQGDEMTEWIPVSQVLNPGSGAQTVATAPAAPVFAATYPPQPGYVPVVQLDDPPNLNWVLLLVIDIVTLSLFQMVWNLVVAAWMKRVRPDSKALVYYIVAYVLLVLNTGLSIPIYVAMINHTHYSSNLGLSLLGIVAWALRLMARFNMKNSLEEHFNTVEPIGLRMSGFMTFFFGGLYIQAKLNHINEIKRAIRYGQYGR